jgi:hypothetical protein
MEFMLAGTKLETERPAVVSFRAVDRLASIQDEHSNAGESEAGPPRRKAAFLFGAVIALISAGLLIYSQTMSFVWDEGFHILAAQLIHRGKTPYIDFCFPQTPLNAYWNAGWMSLFGESWHVTHVLAALAVSGAVFLIADYIFRFFPVPRWRLAGAIVVACFVGLNVVVVQFGTVTQAYGIDLLLTVAAFRAGVAAVRREGWLVALLAGLLVGTAAGCSLLTAPMLPVLLVWMFICNEAGNRWVKLAVSIVGAAVPFTPVLWLFAKAPRQVLFNIVQYQAIFRRVKWTGATTHDVDVLSAWLADAQSLLLGLLAVAGILFISKTSNWDKARRRELYLCGWLAGTSILYIATAHPTFQRYFIFVIPFTSVLAAAGLYWTGSRLHTPDRPLWPALIVSVLVTLSLGRALFDDRDSTTWMDYEAISKKVDQVTPPGGAVYADELVYFITKRPPPPGMEFSYSHKLDLPADQEALYHVISESELDAQVRAGKYATVQSCNDDRMDEMKLAELFPNKVDIKDCSIFWGKVKTAK